jgi:amino acid transporter
MTMDASGSGFDGCLTLLSVVAVLCTLLSFSTAELSTTVPVSGGPYVFALHGIGFASVAESIVTCAVIVTGIGPMSVTMTAYVLVRQSALHGVVRASPDKV